MLVLETHKLLKFHFISVDAGRRNKSRHGNKPTRSGARADPEHRTE
jgi:hypothetical protein